MTSSDAPASRFSPPLLIGLGVALAGALVFLLLVLPNRGGVEDVDQTQADVGSEPSAVGSEPSAVGSETPDGGVAATEEPADDVQEPSFEVFSARDPFDQLVTDVSADPVEGTQDTTAPGDDSTPGDTTTPDPDGSPAPPGGPSQTAVGTTTIRLDEVFMEEGEPRVLVQVNSDGYEAGEGDTVAGDLTVLEIEGSCATMRLDDTRFILCEGEQIRK